jgi:anti-sigma factor RsiW
MSDYHHFTDEELLQAIDGELPPERQAGVDVHLAECITCRARRAQIGRAASIVASIYHGDVRSQALRTQHVRQRLRGTLNRVSKHEVESWRIGLSSRLLSVPLSIRAGAVLAAAFLLFQALHPLSLFDSRLSGAPVERDALPNASLTPGATWRVTAEELCADNAREERQISPAVRQEVLREYGMERVPFEEYELDYLITPELGGSPDARNLWPQRYAARAWNAHVKDQLERLLPQLVCDGRLDLATAQADIAADWIAAYKKYFKTDVPLPIRASLLISDPNKLISVSATDRTRARAD